jgi:hypothetical protein
LTIVHAARGRGVAELATSPLALLAAGVGVAAGVAVDLGPAGAIVAGAMLWAVPVAVGLARRRPAVPAPSAALSAPWHELMTAIEGSAARFARARGEARPGPLADRLAASAELVEGVVAAARHVATRADGLARAAAATDAAGLRARLHALEASTGDGDHGGDRVACEPETTLAGDSSHGNGNGSDGDDGESAAALRAHLDAVERAHAATRAAEAGLRRLAAGLAAAALRSEELSARAGGALELARPEADLAELADRLAALQAALDGLAPGPGRPAPDRPSEP